MEIGYACLTKGVYNTNFKRCTLKTASEENLLKLIEHNLETLDRIIDYNIKMGIKFFRISSDIIPFGSSDVNSLEWDSIFKEEFERIGSKIKGSGIRLSMHPGQYTVLNSPRKDVVDRAIEDLEYHNRFLEALGCGRESKIILHIGGVYGEKESAIERFKSNYCLLNSNIKDKLIIENDDKSYNIGEVLEIGKELNIPVVYDNLHNALNPYDTSKGDNYYIKLAGETWDRKDGRQKVHYSQSADKMKTGAHSRTIDLEKIGKFLKGLPDVDIMLEVKDKNLSALKVNNLVKNRGIKALEKEWARYKYNILEHDQVAYNRIRSLLKSKGAYPVIEFYKLIDSALEREKMEGNMLNSLSHVWGYFKDIATEKEVKKYNSYVASFKKGTYSIKAVKNLLLKMAVKYEREYLLESYYFYF